ncbi:MAG: nodulation protein NfeD, partial [Calditrichia bacterium]
MRSILIFILLIISFAPAQKPEVFLLEYDGVINPVATDVIRQSIDKTARADGECLIIQLDTPGGLMKSMQKIVKDILASPVPVVVYIAPPGSRSGSAGVFITYAAHVAAMAPGTNIGAAHPVNFGGGADSSETLMEKITNDAVASITSVAEKRGRNAEWAEKAVRESASIPASEALELHVIDVLAPDVDSLLSYLNGRSYEVLN